MAQESVEKSGLEGLASRILELARELRLHFVFDSRLVYCGKGSCVVVWLDGSGVDAYGPDPKAAAFKLLGELEELARKRERWQSLLRGFVDGNAALEDVRAARREYASALRDLVDHLKYSDEQLEEIHRDPESEVEADEYYETPEEQLARAVRNLCSCEG